MDTHPGEVGPVELTTKYDSIFSAQEAASGGWPDRLTLKAIAWAESGLDEKAIPLDASGKPISTARGLFQMSKGAWEDVMSFNHTLPSWSTGKFDPMWNCMAAAGYLHLVAVGARAHLKGINSLAEVPLVVINAGYNLGPGSMIAMISHCNGDWNDQHQDDEYLNELAVRVNSTATAFHAYADKIRETLDELRSVA